MPVTISFRGPMVVVTKGECVSRILIPNAETPSVAEMGPVQSHTLGVIHLDAARVEQDRFVVPHGAVMISASGAQPGTPCEKDLTVDALASLRELVGGSRREPLELKPDDDPTLAACVRFTGGRLTSRVPTKAIYQFPSTVNPNPPAPRFLPLITDWTTLDASATIDFGGRRETVRVNEGDHIYLVNIDNFDVGTKFPMPESMEHGQQVAHVGTNEDQDFRLSYTVMRPRTARSLTEWLALPGQLLPVPFFLTNPIDQRLLQLQTEQKTSAFRESVDDYMFDPDSHTDCIHSSYEEDEV